MISPDKHAAVTLALREAFGATAFEDIRTVTGGHTSALVFRIVVEGIPYLLRIAMRPNDATLPQHFTCMKLAAEAGLAPRVWYTSIDDQLAITDFVDARPLPLKEGLVRMPQTLRSLHALLPFPTRVSHLNTTCTFLLNQGPAVDGFLQRFQTANIVPVAECQELFTRLSQLAAVYPRHSDLVSSHNDLFKPDNILFDGQRVWLVDWEAAFLNDRYADLAVVANLVVANDVEEAIYLQEYLGHPPGEYQQARFFLARQLAHIFYAMVFLLQGSSGEPADPNEPPPKDFHRLFWQGEVDLADKRMKAVYGRFHWSGLLDTLRQPRFDEALKIVADPHRER